MQTRHGKKQPGQVKSRQSHKSLCVARIRPRWSYNVGPEVSEEERSERSEKVSDDPMDSRIFEGSSLPFLDDDDEDDDRWLNSFRSFGILETFSIVH